jgi:hypothetical protein
MKMQLHISSLCPLWEATVIGAVQPRRCADRCPKKHRESTKAAASLRSPSSASQGMRIRSESDFFL